MTTAAVFGPNDPDILPDYVDVPPAPVAPPAFAAAAAAHRADECIPNVPDAPPDFLSPAEEQAVARRIESRTAAEPSDPAAAVSRWKWSLAALVFVAGAFGALLFSQAISAAALAATLPVWAQYALLLPFGLCCLAVIGGCAALFRAYLRLRTLRQVDMNALEELRLRARTRQDAMEQYRAARARIEEYVKSYPLDAASRARLLSAGLAPAHIDSLAAARDFLADRSQDSRTWLAEYSEQYQSTLDKAAAARTAAWSLKAAGCVIASPLPLLDALLVLGISLKLIRDLATLYNVRAGRVGTLLILRKAVAAAFIAGVAEEATEAAGALATEHLAGLVGAKIIGTVTPKLGEGVINALFIRHVGRATAGLLQPIKPPGKANKANKAHRTNKGKE